MKNALYFGDNLKVMREMEGGTYHLCYLDPPYNSGRDYTTSRQQKAFEDTWRWNTAARDNQAAVLHYDGRHPELVETMGNLSHCLNGFNAFLTAASMRAYLAFMAPRLAEIWRLLTPDGSVYLHCDAHASHYLKVMMDVIFGAPNFRNEIVWGYKTGGTPQLPSQFARKHDIILFFTKSPNNLFHPQTQKSYVPTLPEPHTASGQRLGVQRDKLEKYRDTQMRDWWVDTGLMPEDDIKPLFRNDKERLGYPTQKPVKLVERIIKASSNPGDIVFDPFCGCGTALDAAQGLNRHWVGIELSKLALEPLERRLWERYHLRANVDYRVETWE